ncbi:MAG TPA: hypothetical protein VFB62_21925 [Polyangiaceae bacterium]|nr:hypothetical protein [Polyangiaceae bacterium]
MALSAVAAPNAPPTAEQKETARNLMQIGDTKFGAGDFAAALEAYEAADAIMRVPTTGLAVGRARARLGMLVEAVDVLQRVGRHAPSDGDTKAFAEARDAAKRLDTDLARRIPTIEVVVKGPAADTPIEVFIDGGAVPANGLPRRVNPGKHVVSARAPGYLAAETSIEVAEQQHEAVELALEPGGPPPEVPREKRAPPKRTSTPAKSDSPSPLMIAGFAVGGAGLAVGIATGVVSLVRENELEARCGGTSCPESERSNHDDIMLLANVSNVAFAVGGVGVVAGIVGLVLELQDDGPSGWGPEQARLVIGPGSLGMRGSF